MSRREHDMMYLAIMYSASTAPSVWFYACEPLIRIWGQDVLPRYARAVLVRMMIKLAATRSWRCYCLYLTCGLLGFPVVVIMILTRSGELRPQMQPHGQDDGCKQGSACCSLGSNFAYIGSNNSTQEAETCLLQQKENTSGISQPSFERKSGAMSSISL